MGVGTPIRAAQADYPDLGDRGVGMAGPDAGRIRKLELRQEAELRAADSHKPRSIEPVRTEEVSGILMLDKRQGQANLQVKPNTLSRALICSLLQF